MQPIESLNPQFINNMIWAVPVNEQNYNQMTSDAYMYEMMNFQNFLNLELLKNQNLIAEYINSKRDTDKYKTGKSTASSTSECQQAENVLQKCLVNENIIIDQNDQKLMFNEEQKQNLRYNTQKNKKKGRKINSDSQYEPERQESQNLKISKSSQSKNVPKNFSKAILLFIKRKQNLIKKIVEQNGGSFEQFNLMCEQIKGKVNSISQLRSLWVQQESKYAKIMRIVSNIYIRKYSLQHIFNSRIQDYTKHLKYRNKICQVLKNPQQFTRMKDY